MQSLKNFEQALTGFNTPEDMLLRKAFGVQNTAYKPAIQTVTASTTLVTDTDLVMELPIGRHFLTYWLPTTVTAAGGLKFQLGALDGLEINQVLLTATFNITGVASVSAELTAVNGSPINGGTTNAWSSVLIIGTIDVKAQGKLYLQFAQQAASGASAIRAGAMCESQQLTYGFANA